jgi:hypothetical protein
MASPIVTNTSAQLNGRSLIVGVTATLTDAQIKASPTTPVSIVSAPGAGMRLRVLGASGVLDCTGGAYTNINTTYCAAMVLCYTDAASGVWQAMAPYLNDASLATPFTRATIGLGGTTKTYVNYIVPNMNGLNAGASSGATEWVAQPDLPLVALCENQALFLSTDNNGSGVFTGGNVANSYHVTVYICYEAV